MGGPAPKLPGQRRRYNQPALGEWVELKPLEAPILPNYGRRFTIPRQLWEAWRSDPVGSQWSEADAAWAIELAEQWIYMDHGEQRQRATALGLTPAGKRSLRWRTPNEVKTIAEQPPPVKRLRVVKEQGA